MVKNQYCSSKQQIIQQTCKKLRKILIKLMKKNNIDATRLEKCTGVPASTINRFRSSKISNPTVASLAPLADFFAIKVSQLIGEEPFDMSHRIDHQPSISNTLLTPVLSWDKLEKNVILNKDVAHCAATEWITVDNCASNMLFALSMQGDFMEPRFPEGTLLIFDQSLIPKNRSFILVSIEKMKKMFFRQLLMDSKDLYLRALHPDFNEIIPFQAGQYKIIGVMIEARMNFK